MTGGRAAGALPRSCAKPVRASAGRSAAARIPRRRLSAMSGLLAASVSPTKCRPRYGRMGTHFYAFEAQQVVPDIVVLGKPIGNGYPLGAVVTTPRDCRCVRQRHGVLQHVRRQHGVVRRRPRGARRARRGRPAGTRAARRRRLLGAAARARPTGTARRRRPRHAACFSAWSSCGIARPLSRPRQRPPLSSNRLRDQRILHRHRRPVPQCPENPSADAIQRRRCGLAGRNT